MNALDMPGNPGTVNDGLSDTYEAAEVDLTWDDFGGVPEYVETPTVAILVTRGAEVGANDSVSVVCELTAEDLRAIADWCEARIREVGGPSAHNRESCGWCHRARNDDDFDPKEAQAHGH